MTRIPYGKFQEDRVLPDKNDIANAVLPTMD